MDVMASFNPIIKLPPCEFSNKKHFHNLVAYVIAMWDTFESVY